MNSGSSPPAAFGVRLNGVRSTALFSAPATLIVAVWCSPGRVDVLVQHVAVAVARVGVGRQQREDAVEPLAEAGARGASGAGRAGRRHTGRGVAAGEDAAVVTEDAVLARAARDPVVAPAADQVVVAGVAEDDVVSCTGVDGVVAGLAVHLVGPTDVRTPVPVTIRRAEQVGTEVRTTRGVVEQGDTADDERLAGVAVVVDEADVLLREPDIGAVDADDPDDLAVVGDDRVCVEAVRVAEGPRR